MKHRSATSPKTALDPICVSVPEAARLLGIGRSSVYREIDAHRLRTLKAGKRRLVPMDAIRSWLQNLPASAA